MSSSRTGIARGTGAYSPWRTVEQVEIATLEYGDWSNHRRLHSTCGDATVIALDDVSGSGADAATAA